MNTNFRMIAYANKCIAAYADVIQVRILPTPIAVIGDTDYCGMLLSYGDDILSHTYMALHLDNIKELALQDNIDIEQAMLETIYHEWIHHTQALCHFDDIPNMESHDNETWEQMIDIGIDQGFIHRRDI